MLNSIHGERRVGTIGLLGKRISRYGKRSRAAASADVSILTSSALSFQSIGVAKSAKYRRVLVDLHDILLREQAARDWHEAVGIDRPSVADEENSLTVVDAHRHKGFGAFSARPRRFCRRSRMLLLSHEAPEVRRLGCLQQVRLPLRVCLQFGERPFRFVRV